AHGVAGGCFLAAAVEREDGGFLKGTWMERAGRMGQMVRHEMPFERPLGSHAAKARFEMMRRSIRKLARSIDDRREEQSIPRRISHRFDWRQPRVGPQLHAV